MNVTWHNVLVGLWHEHDRTICGITDIRADLKSLLSLSLMLTKQSNIRLDKMIHLHKQILFSFTDNKSNDSKHINRAIRVSLK